MGTVWVSWPAPRRQGEPGGQRVESGSTCGAHGVVAASSTASNTGSALGQEISPGNPRRANPRLPGCPEPRRCPTPASAAPHSPPAPPPRPAKIGGRARPAGACSPLVGPFHGALMQRHPKPVGDLDGQPGARPGGGAARRNSTISAVSSTGPPPARLSSSTPLLPACSNAAATKIRTRPGSSRARPRPRLPTPRRAGARSILSARKCGSAR
jgi:hypothetical protein